MCSRGMITSSQSSDVWSWAEQETFSIVQGLDVQWEFNCCISTGFVCCVQLMMNHNNDHAVLHGQEPVAKQLFVDSKC